jgi:hypothetical protein
MDFCINAFFWLPFELALSRAISFSAFFECRNPFGLAISICMFLIFQVWRVKIFCLEFWLLPYRCYWLGKILDGDQCLGPREGTGIGFGL